MKHLFAAARALSALYKVVLYSWLVYVIGMQFKYRKELIEARKKKMLH